jgi:hypothetical protein
MYLLSSSATADESRRKKINENQIPAYCRANLRTTGVASKTISVLDAVVELAMSL